MCIVCHLRHTFPCQYESTNLFLFTLWSKTNFFTYKQLSVISKTPSPPPNMRPNFPLLSLRNMFWCANQFFYNLSHLSTASQRRFHYVIYWPSTEPSFERCTGVNKWKNCRSVWALENNITRCPDGLSPSETGCQRENQLALRPSVTHSWATQAKMRKKCCYGQEGSLGQYSSPSLSPIHFSHTTNITFSKIKCEGFIFL